MHPPPDHFDIDARFIATRSPWEVIEPLWREVSFYDGPTRYEEDLKRFTQPQRLLFACLCYLGEVNNGGHDQFYANNTGLVWRDALVGWQWFERPDARAVLAASAQRMGGTPSLLRVERLEAQRRLRPSFDDLDRQLYRLQRERSLLDSLTTHMRRHAAHFILPASSVQQPGG